MADFLNHPAVQAGVVPFVLALLIGAVLAPTRLLGLAQLAGFLAVVWLAFGFSFAPMTAVRKLVVAAAASGVALIVLEVAAAAGRSRIRALVLLLTAAASLWMLSRLIEQRAWSDTLLPAAASALFVTAMVEAMLRASRDPFKGAAAGLSLGLGTGALALLGSSVVLAMGAIGVGAAAGACLLVQMLRRRGTPPGTTISLPAALICALTVTLVAWQRTLPWYCLLPLLATPFAASLAPARGHPLVRAVTASTLALVPILLSVGLALAAGRQFP